METFSSKSAQSYARSFASTQNPFGRTILHRNSSLDMPLFSTENYVPISNNVNLNKMGFTLFDSMDRLPENKPVQVRTPMSTVLNQNQNQNQNQPIQVVDKVVVKTSAHVSYIVGKQGRKIRELRQRTGTYISTPVNGDDPIFVIKGPLKGVNEAVDAIKIESNKFDHEIYTEAFLATNGKEECINFFLPSHLIGLVVGKKGATIKRIMEQSRTTIETPKVNTINRFRILGTKSAIEQAVSLIKSTITDLMRCSINEEHGPYSITFHVKNSSMH